MDDINKDLVNSEEIENYQIRLHDHFSKDEDKFIMDNYIKLSDKQMAKALNRPAKAISRRRSRLGLVKSKAIKSQDLSEQERHTLLSTMDEKDRRKILEKEVRVSSRFKAFVNSATLDEQNYYVDKYIDFMMDPTVETMTTMEKDALHQAIVSEIRINRYLQQEKEDEKVARTQGRAPISRAQEIHQCQDLIMKAQKSLNVERAQRLKNQGDQALTFQNLIKDMKSIVDRAGIGREAAMLKYIAEKSYNAFLGSKILSGKDSGFDLRSNFINDVMPSGLDSNFIPTIGEDIVE